MKITILGEKLFKDKILPKIDETKDIFYISILDPDTKEPLRENCERYKTYWFYDIEHDIENYKSISMEQAQDIYKLIRSNLGKHLIVHCGAGISRSSAVAEFYHELLGGSYKEMTDVFKNIMPNGRVLQYLRVAEKLETLDDLKINFV